MSRPAPDTVPTKSARRHAAPPRRKFIALRLSAWSDWDRQVIRGVQRFAHDRPDWRMYVEGGDNVSSKTFAAELTLDGLITSVLRDMSPAWRQLIKRLDPCVVAISSAVPQRLSNIPRVRVDDNKVAASIGRHFLAGGFRHLAYFALPQPGAVVEDTRLKAIGDFAAREGCPFHLLPAPKVRGELSAGERMRWIQQLPKPIGIAAWNMQEARRLVTALDRAGIAVPEQVAVVAWDDDPMLAETLEPTISAAVLPAERLGFEAAQLLDRMFSGAPRPVAPVVIEPTGVLRVRQSSDVSTLADRDAHLAMQYIREHGTEPIKVTHVASALRLSRRSLEVVFSRVSGKTLHDAIMEVRLERARQLLAETDWPLARVADRAGLGTEQTLRRLFLSKEQMTPGAYRARFSGV
ncbi:MAG TPA: substrate-binding domain-containing protein [Tepidisphaeraceae bacterium]|nr:substrate-binding domain-containing protein [Tepidisphaeraceae bacterium]